MGAAAVQVPLAVGAEGLEHRPVQLEILHQLHANGDLSGNLDAGAAKLGVAHGGVHVAHLQKRAGNAHGEVQARALGDLLVVHVAAVAAHEAVDDVGAGRRGADDADHGVDREADLVERGHAVLDGNLLGAIAGGLEQRAAVIVGGDGALIGHLHLVDVDHEHVAGLGALDVDGARGGIGETIRVIKVCHGGVLIGTAVAEAVLRVELQHLAGLGRGARLVVLGEFVNLIGDDLHDAPFFMVANAACRRFERLYANRRRRATAGSATAGQARRLGENGKGRVHHGHRFPIGKPASTPKAKRREAAPGKR